MNIDKDKIFCLPFRLFIFALYWAENQQTEVELAHVATNTKRPISHSPVTAAAVRTNCIFIIARRSFRTKNFFCVYGVRDFPFGGRLVSSFYARTFSVWLGFATACSRPVLVLLPHSTALLSLLFRLFSTRSIEKSEAVV